jgi:Divergent InlB B-repeat domain
MNLKTKRISLAMMQAVLAIGMAACGGASDDTADVADATAQDWEARVEALRYRTGDTIAPTVTIGSAPVADSAGIVNLSGTAADNRRVYRVTWRNDLGGSGTATLSGTVNTAAWVVNGLQLQVGTNVITVTAVDGAGNVSAAAKMTLVRGAATPVPAPAPVQYLLTVASGAGGQVTSTPVSIDCGVAATTCSAQLPAGTSVSLTATPVAGYQFIGWSGVCSGMGACVVTMSSANSVTASFLPATTAAWVVQLGWAASSGAVAGYRLYHGSASGNYTDGLTVSSPNASFPTTVPGLHYFAVSALNSAGAESARSAEISVNVN